jgi:hypothetical protein
VDGFGICLESLIGATNSNSSTTITNTTTTSSARFPLFALLILIFGTLLILVIAFLIYRRFQVMKRRIKTTVFANKVEASKRNFLSVKWIRREKKKTQNPIPDRGTSLGGEDMVEIPITPSIRSRQEVIRESISSLGTQRFPEPPVSSFARVGNWDSKRTSGFSFADSNRSGCSQCSHCSKGHVHETEQFDGGLLSPLKSIPIDRPSLKIAPQPLKPHLTGDSVSSFNSNNPFKK